MQHLKVHLLPLIPQKWEGNIARRDAAGISQVCGDSSLGLRQASREKSPNLSKPQDTAACRELLKCRWNRETGGSAQNPGREVRRERAHSGREAGGS